MKHVHIRAGGMRPLFLFSGSLHRSGGSSEGLQETSLEGRGHPPEGQTSYWEIYIISDYLVLGWGCDDYGSFPLSLMKLALTNDASLCLAPPHVCKSSQHAAGIWNRNRR